MSKIQVKASTLLAPLPAVMVSLGSMQNSNIITVAWTGVICSDPPRMYVSVRHERHSYQMLLDKREFVINLTSEKLLAACDWCGIRSGRDFDKFAEMNLVKTSAPNLDDCPMIEQSPLCIECKVFDVLNLGSHDMFLADVVAVHADESIMDEQGKIDYQKANLVCYQHGDYYRIGKKLGRFGFAAQKKFIAKHGKGFGVDVSCAALAHRKPSKKSGK